MYAQNQISVSQQTSSIFKNNSIPDSLFCAEKYLGAENLTNSNPIKKKRVAWNKGLTIEDPRVRKYISNKIGVPCSEETKRKIGLANKGKIGWSRCLTKYTDERLRIIGEKISKTNKGNMIAWNKYLKIGTYEEQFGEEEAKKRKKEMSLFMKNNPNSGQFKKGEHRSPKTEFKKGIIPWSKGKVGLVSWSKGLTKEVDERLKLMGEKASKTKKRLFKEGKLKSWKKGKKFDELFGDRANEIIEKIKEARARQILPMKDTLIETKIQKFLKQLKIDFFTHHYIKDIEHKYRCDIFIPKLNLVIECDGDFWHANPEFYPTKKLIKRQKWKREMDNFRTKELIEKGFKVLRLWGSEIKIMNISQFKDKIIG